MKLNTLMTIVKLDKESETEIDSLLIVDFRGLCSKSGNHETRPAIVFVICSDNKH